MGIEEDTKLGPGLDWDPLKKEAKVSKSAPATGSSAKAEALKETISGILMGAINGQAERHRTPEGFIRWGLVEREMHDAINRALR